MIRITVSDREAIERENKRLATRLKFARWLDKALFAKLAAGDWIARHQNVLRRGWIARSSAASRGGRSRIDARRARLSTMVALSLRRMETAEMTITVKAGWDPEAQVWYIADSSLPGLRLEGESLDELFQKLPGGIEDLTGDPRADFELIAPSRVAA